MRINVAVPEPHVSAPVLDSALEAVTRLNESMLRRGDLEPFDMRDPGVRWKPEPPGQEHFDHGRIVSGRGWGDCDDLAPWHAATLRVTGRDPGARAFVRKSGPNRWHAVVRRSSGKVDDPSLAAGMPGPGRGVHGAAQPPMLPGSVGSYEMRPQLALRPVFSPLDQEVEAWQARTDLPWHAGHAQSPADVAMVSLHASPVSDQALVGALEGAISLGEASRQSEDHLDRLRCLSDMLQGASWEECAGEYGDEYADAASAVVGAFFKRFRRKMGRGIKRGWRKVRRPLGKAALKLAPMAAMAIPGVGPAAAAALTAATPMLQKALFKERHRRPEHRGLPMPSAPVPVPQFRAPAQQYQPEYSAQYAHAPQRYRPQSQFSSQQYRAAQFPQRFAQAMAPGGWGGYGGGGFAW